jgi:hypothetical protein
MPPVMKRPPSLMNFATCGCHRKHAIRVLKRFKHFTKPKPKRRGKSPVYKNEAVIKPLKEIRLAANLPCSAGSRFEADIDFLPSSGYIQPAIVSHNGRLKKIFRQREK